MECQISTGRHLVLKRMLCLHCSVNNMLTSMFYVGSLMDRKKYIIQQQTVDSHSGSTGLQLLERIVNYIILGSYKKVYSLVKAQENLKRK